MRVTHLFLMLTVIGCATAPKDPVDTASVFRRLAWIEGSIETDYQPNEEIVERRLAAWNGKAPSLDDREEYLKYLSIVSASNQRKVAELQIREYLNRYPKDTRGVFLLGVFYLRTKKPELARFLFAKLEKDSDFQWKSLLFNNLGMMSLEDGNRDQAIGYFEKAVSASPPIAAAHTNMGSIYLQSRSYEKAEGQFRRAVEIDDQFEDVKVFGVRLNSNR